ncbi:FtsW/RodA/SpoVE family cell cycle protein [Sporolactobacillus sp. THM7-7]|nr:FtsW/RodA/SpoVE family cell cycle protein [Sporolactobacillus sp. THM7-7]
MLQKLIRNYDYSLLVTMLLLIAFGLIMVYSASSVWAVTVLQKTPSYLFVRQVAWSLIALPIAAAGLLIPYQVYKLVVKLLIFFSVLLLVMVYLFGHSANNAQSWFALGPFNIQPAEMVKIVLIFYLASVYSNKQKAIDDFKTSVLPPLIIVMLFFVLVAKQPDMGTAMILMAVSAIMVVCSGLRFRHLLFLVTVSTVFLAAVFFRFLSDNQSGRFTAAYDPFSVADTAGHQLINSYIAIASGGLTGKGLGNGIEKAGFLPEPHTDFIIAVIGEELGILGILFVVLCLAYLVLKGFVIAIRCKDVFGSLLAIGISSLLAIQTFVNLGAASGLVPVTGVTLPFISYGGSSLIVMIFAVSVLINISAFVNMKRSNNRQEGKRENVTSAY